MRAIVFYPLVALAAALSIGASIGFAAIGAKPKVEAGRQAAGAFVFDARALSHLDPGDAQVIHIPRTGLAKPLSLQIATTRVAGEPNPAVLGARLLLDPATAATLANRPLIAEVRVRPVYGSTASALSISAQAPGVINWVTLPMPQQPSTLRFRLPPTDGPPEAIGIWPTPQADEYYTYYGLEIDEIRLRPDAG